jgi:hypothetical protein
LRVARLRVARRCLPPTGWNANGAVSSPNQTAPAVAGGGRYRIE